MSSSCGESLSGSSGGIPVSRVYSSGSSRAEASFGSVVSGPASQWLAGRQDQIVHVAGVPLSSIRIDCRLRHSIVGCDDVVVGVVVGWWKAKGTTCASSSSLRANDEFLAVYGTSSPAWKRG